MIDRTKELEKAIEDFRSERLETMQNHAVEYIQALNSTFCQSLNIVIEEQLQRQSKDEEAKIKHLYLCRLHTSDYTGSYKAIIGMSDQGMYLDEKASQAEWNPSPLYANLEKEMGAVAKFLQRSFIRLQESELFAMKQRLSDDSWVFLEACFRILVKDNFHLVINSKLRLTDKVLILCGDYMDRLKIIDIRKNASDTKEED